MAIADLALSERVTLVSLARLVIRADGTISTREATAMQELATAVGPERFVEAIQAAQEQAPSPEATRRCAATVTVPQTRQLLYRLIHYVATSDGMSPNESAELRWLAALWELPVDPVTLVLPPS
jgi:CRISPR/Cas system endoribonuclease Cas6 (RAMP superfamily)